ncbi:exosortase/archaeosortase family protein [bacterium]|nr:exosortase/archaeosortase family protein [bacterium]
MNGTPIIPGAAGSTGSGSPASGVGPHRRDGRFTPPPADEGLIEGTKRRLGEFLADLKRPEAASAWGAIALLTALLIYSYWPGLLNAQSSWNNPQYSHGWIVPLFTLGLLFWWRQPLEPVTLGARVAGVLLLAASLGLRLAAARYRIVTIDMYTFVPAVAGVFLLGGGWSMFRWAWAPIGFLIFMYPLPDEATRYLLGPLQTLATMVSTYALQTLGFDAYREGNKIIVGSMQLGVVDACSGLRMLTIFTALAVALVMLGERPWYDNLVILASAIPIALIVNSIRITITGVLFQVANSEVAEMVFHDLAGWVMMPMALGMLFLLQWILTHLFLTEDAAVAALVPLPRASEPVSRAAGRARHPGPPPGIRPGGRWPPVRPPG